MSRKRWHDYFMDIAFAVATRATCDRKHVGCVIVSPQRTILSTGYNGSIPGAPHCDDAGHDMDKGHCVRTVHAEANAVARAAANGTKIQGADVYLTTYPCWPCYKLLATAGVRKIYYAESYRPDVRITENAGHHLASPRVGWIEDAILHDLGAIIYYDHEYGTLPSTAQESLAKYMRCREWLPDFALNCGLTPDGTYWGMHWGGTRDGLAFGESFTYPAGSDLAPGALYTLMASAHEKLARVAAERGWR